MSSLQAPSNRKFGIFFAAVFACFSISSAVSGGRLFPLFLFMALNFLLAALLYPRWLSAPNRWWMACGLGLHRLISPVVLAVLFFGFLTPIAILIRLFRIDLLRLKRDPNSASYWIEADKLSANPGQMKHQF